MDNQEININIKVIVKDGEFIKFEKTSNINEFMTNVFLEKALKVKSINK